MDTGLQMKITNAFGYQLIIGEYIDQSIPVVDILIIEILLLFFLPRRYSSLDRKSQKNKMKKQAARGINQTTKSTSLSNFNFINKSDDTLETSPTMNINQNEQRRSKEKQW